MKTIDIPSIGSAHYELRFLPLRALGAGLSFPCDDCGSVNMDTLEAGTLRDYLYARAVIGFEFAAPSVIALVH